MEVGCGHGGYLFPFEEMLRARIHNYTIRGYDVASKSIDAAQRHAKEVGSRIQFAVGSSDSLAQPVDWICLNNVVEHVHDPYGFLTNLQGLSQYIWLHGPIEQSIAHILLNTPPRSFRTGRHLHFWSWSSLNVMFQDRGYAVVAHRFDCIDRGPIFGSWKYRAMQRIRHWAYRLMPRVSTYVFGGNMLVLLKNSR